ncbi:MAG: sugar phosphate isomerase/epimerase [Candidatus Peregrinibacteria bacterium Greene0416_62]|nr:MAG: sugar phosphate isomerase/epimerase [Candidatus Peregrinibacteria bacterium Greene0416_62]
MPFAELMKLLGELKFNGFELGGFDIHPKAGPAFEVGGWFADSNWVCEELKDLWASHNLECYGFAPDLWKHSFVAKPNPKAYDADFDAALKFADMLNIDGIRVDTLDKPNVIGDVVGLNRPEGTNAVSFEQALQLVVPRFKRCCERAHGEFGMNVLWEPEPGFLFNKPGQIEAVLNEVDCHNFSLIGDVCHFDHIGVRGSLQPGEKEVQEGGIGGMFQRFASSIKRVHLIDSNGEINQHGTSAHPPFGEGTVNFDELIPQILAAGAGDDTWCIDLCFWPNAAKAIASCKDFADALNVKHCAA